MQITTGPQGKGEALTAKDDALLTGDRCAFRRSITAGLGFLERGVIRRVYAQAG
jgi:hypothetical protein